MPLFLWNHFLPWAIILLQLVNEPFFSSKPPPTLWGSIENLWSLILCTIYRINSFFVTLKKKLNCDLLSVTFSLSFNTPCVPWYAALCSRPLFQSFLSTFFFSIDCTFNTKCPLLSAQSNFTLFTRFFPLVHIVVFVGDFSSWCI